MNINPESPGVNPILDELATSLEHALALLASLEDSAIPAAVSNTISQNLRTARASIRSLREHECIGQLDKGKSRDISGQDIRSPVDYEEDEEDLPFLLPAGFNAQTHTSSESRMVHAIIYAERGKLPFEAIFYAPESSRLEFEMYQLPQPWTNSKFLAYCVFTNSYLDANRPLDVRDRGLFLIFRRSSVPIRDCPGMAKWQTDARESAEGIANERVYEARSKSLPASSPTSKSARVNNVTTAVTSSSK
ncbi:hypothetical protein B0H11DRAFT_1979561 [Mycena galericulata]|nr:hypothetical protein B0H11DRAFT_1979561 [Mycena galericulata]